MKNKYCAIYQDITFNPKVVYLKAYTLEEATTKIEMRSDCIRCIKCFESK